MRGAIVSVGRLGKAARSGQGAAGVRRPGPRGPGWPGRFVESIMQSDSAHERGDAGGAPAHDILRTSTDHRDAIGQVERSNGLLEVCRTPLQRLQAGQCDVRAHDRPDKTGKPRAGTDVDDVRARGHQRCGDGAIEQVPVPQPRDLAGAEQPTLHPRAGQEFGIHGQALARLLIGNDGR